MSKAKKEPVLCEFCNHPKRLHVDGKGACVSTGVVCVMHCRKFQAPAAAKVKFPYVIYLQHKEEAGRVVAEDVYAESKRTWQCAKRDLAIAKHYSKELWEEITKEQFELLLTTAAERAKVEAKTSLPLPRKIFLQHKDRPNDLVAETLREDREDMWRCGGALDALGRKPLNVSYYDKGAFQEITEEEYNSLMALGAENTTTGSQRTVFLSQLITGKAIAEVLYAETGSFWLCGDTGEREYSKKEWVKISKEAYRHDATPRMKDIPTTTRPIYLQRVTGELAVETLYKETDVSWVCGNNGDYHLRKDVWSEISELDYKALLEIRGEDTAAKKLRPIYLLRYATGEVHTDVLFGETATAWILGRKGINSIPKKGMVEISEDGYHAMLEDVPEDYPCECGLEGCKRCHPEEEDEIFYPNTYRVTLDITTRQAITLQDVARLLDTKKIASPFVGAEVVSIARRE